MTNPSGTPFDTELPEMFLDRLMNQGNLPLIEQTVKFAQARHRMLAENIANVSTPNYQQKDLQVERFQQTLRDRVDERSQSAPGRVRFDELAAAEVARSTSEDPGDSETPPPNILFHDRGNRSIEQLQSDLEQNALMHNMMTELLRKQFSSIQDALKERVT
jgi:flagellar basal-body rod protein FlgB